MGKRYLSLDFLRGVSIFGMIFSAIIPYGVLPAWMYHIQNPPPSHALDMGIPGVGWVDLVFPVFIFCMGVAIPLSGGKSGSCSRVYVKGVLKRFSMLWLFSYLYVLLNFTTATGVWPQIFTILGFGALFMLYSSSRQLYKVIGFISSVLMVAIGHKYFGEVVSVQRRGIIIFLLAFLYLFGSLIWYFTRGRLGLRGVIFSIIFFFTFVTRALDWPAITYANPSVRWWFNMEYIYFLLLLIPATVVGDIIKERLSVDGEPGLVPAGNRIAVHAISLSLPCFVVWQCYALYKGFMMANLAVTLCYMAVLCREIKRYMPQYRQMAYMAALLIVWGIVMAVLEGGIKKVPCTISYCFATCGISVILLIFSDYFCKYLGGSFFVKLFSGAGQNPLMSYITFDSLLVPLMKATGFISIYTSIYTSPDGNPAIGILRAAAAVLITMWVVSLFSKRGIFWRA